MIILVHDTTGEAVTLTKEEEKIVIYYMNGISEDADEDHHFTDDQADIIEEKFNSLT